MSKPKLSPWFNALTQPPVNGGLLDDYELRCTSRTNGFEPHRISKSWILRRTACPKCQWRGILK